jgi:hypothetical protein
MEQRQEPFDEQQVMVMAVAYPSIVSSNGLLSLTREVCEDIIKVPSDQLHHHRLCSAWEKFRNAYLLGRYESPPDDHSGAWDLVRRRKKIMGMFNHRAICESDRNDTRPWNVADVVEFKVFYDALCADVKAHMIVRGRSVSV